MRFDPDGLMAPGVLLEAHERVTAADHVIAIDVGTQSVRALVVRASRTFVAMAKVRIEPYVSPRPGWAEQDPELYWRSVGDACRQVLADPAVRLDAIAGLTLTTQRGTVVVTDDAGTPLRPAIVWLDQRRTAGCTADRRRDRPAVPGGRRPRHGRELRRRLRGQLDPRQRAGHLARDPTLLASCPRSSPSG